MAAMILPSVAVPVAEAAPQQKSTTKTTAKKRPGKAAKPAKGASAGKKSAKQETSADVKKRQAATQKEIRQTEEQIRENDRSIKLGLNELGKLESDINVSKEKIASTNKQISALSGQITGLEGNIKGNEKELSRLRDEYLKAVRKMRVAQKNQSALAFIFASENFNQALRRMRYLKQFSAWKDRQSAAIAGKTAELKTQREALARTKAQQDEALRRQKAEQSTLQAQHTRQDAIVADLKVNGAALKTHLSKKQAEANQLRNRISDLIAQEERKAAEERARREAEERQRREAEERERREAEERARREAEERQRREVAEAAAKAAAQEAETLAKAEEPKKTETPKKAEAPKRVEEPKREVAASTSKGVKEDKGDNVAVAKARRHSTKKETPKETKKETKKDSKKKGADEPKQTFADARKRKPRGTANAGVPAPTKVETAPSAAKRSAAASTGDFGKMKGSLPHPASGSFKVTSRFGRQSLPDLPDVVYDNPGIDAEVGSGASALAVYPGKVSGVYMVPGYNTVVIVNHGNYYTVYGNISAPAVKVGDSVKAGQGLGGLAPDEDDRNHSSIHFEVWRNREKLNPLEWLR